MVIGSDAANSPRTSDAIAGAVFDSDAECSPRASEVALSCFTTVLACMSCWRGSDVPSPGAGIASAGDVPIAATAKAVVMTRRDLVSMTAPL